MSDLTEDSLIEMMVGRKLEDQYPRLTLPRGKEAGGKNLCGRDVHDVSFTLHENEILGVSG